MWFKIFIAFSLYLVIAIYGWEFLVLLGAAIVGLLAKKAMDDSNSASTWSKPSFPKQVKHSRRDRIHASLKSPTPPKKVEQKPKTPKKVQQKRAQAQQARWRVEQLKRLSIEAQRRLLRLPVEEQIQWLKDLEEYRRRHIK